MKLGDLVQFEGGVAVWDTRSSHSHVIGRTRDGVVYLILGEGRGFGIDVIEEVRVLGSDGVMGWVSSRTVKREL